MPRPVNFGLECHDLHNKLQLNDPTITMKRILDRATYQEYVVPRSIPMTVPTESLSSSASSPPSSAKTDTPRRSSNAKLNSSHFISLCF